MKFEKIETIRVKYDDEFFCDITPNGNEQGYYDFWLYKNDCGLGEFMFSASADTTEELVEMAEFNIPDYIPDYIRRSVQ